MEVTFSGKRALVTGAAQGIGLAVVKKLIACGAEVVALDVQGEKLKEEVKDLPGVEVVVADLNNWESIGVALESAGHVDLVANVAGVHLQATIQEMQEVVVNRVLNVNLKAIMAICKHTVNDWSSKGTRGAIVNIASVAAMRPFASEPVYSASKAAVVQYTRCLALKCAPKGIRVNAISPGTVNTEMARKAFSDPSLAQVVNDMTPMEENFSEPEDIANAVAFLLCNNLARRITGVNLHVDGGLMLS